jgi:ribosome-associated toxin RatA of RatAB toxin-antitoxin module
VTARCIPQFALVDSPPWRGVARFAHAQLAWLRIAVAALIHCCATAAMGAADMPSVTVDVEHQGDAYVVVATLLAPVTPSAAWAVLTDFDHMADFMPTLTASRVLKRVDNNVLVQQSGKMELGTFRMPFESQRMVELAPPTTIHSRQLRGNMQRVDSTTTFSETPGGTRIDYRVEIVPKLWMPETIAGPLLRTEVDRQFNAILKELIRRNTP